MSIHLFFIGIAVWVIAISIAFAVHSVAKERRWYD